MVSSTSHASAPGESDLRGSERSLASSAVASCPFPHPSRMKSSQLQSHTLDLLFNEEKNPTSLRVNEKNPTNLPVDEGKKSHTSPQVLRM